jgi:hypothetical protein
MARSSESFRSGPRASVGYVVSVSRIADRQMILAGYRLADLLTLVIQFD